MDPVRQSNSSQIYYSFKDGLVKNKKTVAVIVLLATTIFLTAYLVFRNYTRKLNKEGVKETGNKSIEFNKDKKEIEGKNEIEINNKTYFTENSIVKPVDYKKDPILKDTDFTIIQKIFKDTNFECVMLPTYPEAVEGGGLPEFDKMDANIMKGKTEESIPYIAFKLQCTIREEYVDKICNNKTEEYINIIKQDYKINQELNFVFILFSPNSKKNPTWEQYSPSDVYFFPKFFEKTLSEKSEEENIQSFKKLIIKKEKIDLNDVLWKLCD